MGYAEALEEKANAQGERIIELEASVDGQTVLTNTTYYAMSSFSMGARKELIEILAMMKQPADLVTAQAATVATLSTNINYGGGGAGRNIYKENTSPVLYALQVGSVPQGRKLFGAGFQQGEELPWVEERLHQGI